MIQFHRLMITGLLLALFSFQAFSEAPVVDDSENFAMLEEQQDALAQAIERERPVALSDEREDALVNETIPGNPALEHENAILLDKIQNLQQEVQELRGQMEVQAHDLKLLQQQQLAFYKDLDSRLSESRRDDSKNDLALDIDHEKKSVPIQKVTLPTAQSKPAQTHHTTNQNPADEQISYLAAYELIEKKQYDAALTAMQAFVQQYPQSGYSANAQYWLGELFLVQKNYSEAMVHFDTVLQLYPSSSKAAASLLKKGYALAENGQKEAAKQSLNQVVKQYPDTNPARLARAKLETLNT